MVQKSLRRPEKAGRLQQKRKDLMRERRDLQGRLERAFLHDDYESISKRLRAVNKEIADIEEILDQ